MAGRAGEAKIANEGYSGNMNPVPPRAGLPGFLFWQMESGRCELDGKKIPRQSAGSATALSSQAVFCNVRVYFPLHLEYKGSGV